MNAWHRVAILVALVFTFGPFSTASLLGSDTDKRIEPKCSAKFDPANSRLILVVCDFSSLDVAQKIKEATTYIDILDSDDRKIGSETFQFVSKDGRPLNGGSKYYRSFEYSTKGVPISGKTVNAKVRMSRTEATIEPSVAAIEK